MTVERLYNWVVPNNNIPLQRLNHVIRERLNFPVEEPFSSELKTTVFDVILNEVNEPGSYNNFLTNWSIMKSINFSLYSKLKILSKSILLTQHAITNFANQNLQNNLIESNLNPNILNTITAEAIESQFLFTFSENLSVLKELLLMENLSIDSECFIYMSLLVRVCFILTPGLGIKGLNEYSENLVAFKSFKQKILTRIIKLEEIENRRNSYFYTITKNRVLDSKFIKSVFLYSLSGLAVGGVSLLMFKKEKELTTYEHGKRQLGRISEEIGSLWSIVFSNFAIGFIKTFVQTATNALVISIKATIQESINSIKTITRGTLNDSTRNSNTNENNNNENFMDENFR